MLPTMPNNKPQTMLKLRAGILDKVTVACNVVPDEQTILPLTYSLIGQLSQQITAMPTADPRRGQLIKDAVAAGKALAAQRDRTDLSLQVRRFHVDQQPSRAQPRAHDDPEAPPEADAAA
jgi:hypothetical protein